MSNEPQMLTAEDSELAAAFPAHFLWGTATAAYQIEGAVNEDGRGPSIWDTFAALPGKIYKGQTGAVAVNHYHLLQEDVALMQQLHLNAYRFSLAWPRILPQGRGTVEPRGLDFYDRLVDALLQQGIKPFVTLYHWDLPQALEDEGGWLRRDVAYAFADYAEVVAKRLGDRVAAWITHNEPWCSAYLGYALGVHAPGMRNGQAAANVGHHLLLSHGLAAPRLRAYSAPTTQIGITLNFTPAYPVDNSPEHMMAVDYFDTINNRWFLEPIARGRYPDRLFEYLGATPPPMEPQDIAAITTRIDFLGVNNYTRDVVKTEIDPETGKPHYQVVTPVPGACYTEKPWEIYPQALADLLLRLHHDYAIPSLYVTENGAAFHDEVNSSGQVDDPRRVAFLRDYLHAIAAVLKQGVPLNGYFVWSLMDNFEWADGYSKRFGLVYVDYPTQRRIIKSSGHWYAQLIAAFQRTHQR